MKGSAKRSWRSRINQALLRAPSDTEQLLEMLRLAQQENLFTTDALAMLEGVLQVGDMQVRDIMIPRSQVVVLERDASPDALLRIIAESGHSRFPVIGDNRDEVVGILLAKDFLPYAFERRDGRLNVRNMLRPAIFVPESKRLSVLLKEFRASRNHIAIVVDEYGGVAGMVTIEDVLEQIVGEIEDEHDVEEEDTIRKHSAVHYTIKALTPVEDFADAVVDLKGDAARVDLVAIVGVPPDLVDLSPAQLRAPEIQTDADFERILAEPRMRVQIDEADPSLLVPSCDVPELGHAFPPRRIIEYLRDAHERGAGAVAQSICQADYAGAMQALARMVGAR